MVKLKVTKNRLYNIYVKMVYRCYSDKYSQPEYYKDKGIKVCDEWLNDFNTFKIWANENGYKDWLSIDRIDSSGNYTPSNCRWASSNVQARNTIKLARNNTSNFRGVSWINRDNKFRGTIAINNKNIALGDYVDRVLCAKVYDEFVILNDLEHTINEVLAPYDILQLNNKTGSLYNRVRYITDKYENRERSLIGTSSNGN